MQKSTNNNMVLSDKAITMIRNDKRLRAKLTLGMDITESTLYRWLREKHIMMTTARFIYIVSEHTGAKFADMLTKENK